MVGKGGKLVEEETFVICVRRITGSEGVTLVHRSGKHGDDMSKPSTSGTQRSAPRKQSRSPSSSPQNGSKRSRSPSSSSQNANRRSRSNGRPGIIGGLKASSNKIVHATTNINEAVVGLIRQVFTILNHLLMTLVDLLNFDFSKLGIGNLFKGIFDEVYPLVYHLYGVVKSPIVLGFRFVSSTFKYITNVLMRMLYTLNGALPWLILFLLAVAVHASITYWMPIILDMDLDLKHLRHYLHLGRHKPNCVQMILAHLRHPMKFIYKFCVFCPD